MLLRLPLAFAAGWTLYMIAMAMTVYDGLLSLIFQPFVGAFLTLAALATIVLLGAPLLIKSVWDRWQCAWWISLVVFVLSSVSLAASWHPALRVQVYDDQIDGMRDSFNPALLPVGWLGMMFSIAYCPIVGLRGDRRCI